MPEETKDVRSRQLSSPTLCALRSTAAIFGNFFKVPRNKLGNIGDQTTRLCQQHGARYVTPSSQSGRGKAQLS